MIFTDREVQVANTLLHETKTIIRNRGKGLTLWPVFDWIKEGTDDTITVSVYNRVYILHFDTVGKVSAVEVRD
jgi:hypothetical protein